MSKSIIKSFILAHLDCEYLETSENAKDSEKLKALKDCFYNEYGYNVTQFNVAKAIKGWLMGLPSAITIPFYYNEIYYILVEWGYNAEKAQDSEYQEAKYWGAIADFLAKEFDKLP